MGKFNGIIFENAFKIEKINSISSSLKNIDLLAKKISEKLHY